MQIRLSRWAARAVAMACLVTAAGLHAQEIRRPNIVVVVVDDLRWDEIGIAGHPFARTPHIDRVGREGARFLNAFCTTPICSPSRANILTGQHARANGIIDNTDRSEASHRMATFPRALQAVGYETAFIGKWHMGNDDTPRPGFDRWVALKGQGEANNPQLNEDGVRGRVEGYTTDILIDRAVAFIEEEREAPFMLFLAHKALHPNIAQRDDGSTASIGGGGFIPAPRHRGIFADAVVPRRPNAFLPPVGKPALLRQIGNLPPLGRRTATGDGTIRDRQEMLLAIDEGMGRILESLEGLGALDDTVVVVMSDHGYFYGEHGLSSERRLAYEETIRIPLLIRYPRRVEAASAPERFALTIDLAPTLLELAGVEPAASIDGRSLVPLLTGESGPWRDSVFIEYFSDTVFPRIFRMGYQAVRTERYKYIHYVDLEGMDELYDLEADPYEMSNIIESPGASAALERMQEELARFASREPGEQ